MYFKMSFTQSRSFCHSVSASMCKTCGRNHHWFGILLLGSIPGSTLLIAKYVGPTWAHLGPTGPRWAPCWPHEPCYLGSILHVRSAIHQYGKTGRRPHYQRRHVNSRSESDISHRNGPSSCSFNSRIFQWVAVIETHNDCSISRGGVSSSFSHFFQNNV